MAITPLPGRHSLLAPRKAGRQGRLSPTYQVSWQQAIGYIEELGLIMAGLAWLPFLALLQPTEERRESHTTRGPPSYHLLVPFIVTLHSA